MRAATALVSCPAISGCTCWACRECFKHLPERVGLGEKPDWKGREDKRLWGQCHPEESNEPLDGLEHYSLDPEQKSDVLEGEGGMLGARPDRGWTLTSKNPRRQPHTHLSISDLKFFLAPNSYLR